MGSLESYIPWFKNDKNEKDVNKDVDKNNINDISKYSNNHTLLQKRDQPEIKSEIPENPIKKIKISENEVVDVKDLKDNNSGEIFNLQNQMNFSEIDEEEEKIKNNIEKSKKRLNQLAKMKKYKIYKTAFEEKINNNLSFEQEININNIWKTFRDTAYNYFKENEDSLETFFKGLEQKEKNYIIKDINNLYNDYPKSYLKTQIINNRNNNKKIDIGKHIIDSDENKDININNEKINPFAGCIDELKNKQNIELKNIIDSINQKDQIDSNYQKNINSSNIKNYNPLIISQKKNEFNNYSFKCLTNNLNFEILKGTKEGMFSLELENNGSFPWPKNKTFLEFDDSKENINIHKKVLEPLNPGYKTEVIIILNNLDKINLGKYYICLVFKVDGREYGDTLLVNIEVTDNINKNKHKTIIKALRNEFDFTNTMFSNTMIGDALEEFKTFEGAVDYMLKEKN